MLRSLTGSFGFPSKVSDKLQHNDFTCNVFFGKNLGEFWVMMCNSHKD